MSTPAEPRDPRPAEPRAPSAGPTVIHWLLWGALGMVVLGIVGFAIWVRATGGQPAARAEGPTATPTESNLPVLAEVPPFELIDRDGAVLGRDDLLGRPWINDFIFTRCAAICPRMTQEMARLADALENDVDGLRFVSITVDPEHDTPEVLADWASRFGAGPNWHFLTGERDDILTLARQGFLLGVDAAPTDGSAGPDPIVHSNRFVLVDAEARIRGYYDPFDPESVEKLLADVRSLPRGAPNP